MLGTCRGVVVGVVFGALLGPEATGPFCSNAGGHFLVFLLFLLLSFHCRGRPRLMCVGCGGGGG